MRNNLRRIIKETSAMDNNKDVGDETVESIVSDGIADNFVKDKLLIKETICIDEDQADFVDEATGDESLVVNVEEQTIKPMIYKVSERPPFHVMILLATQLFLSSIDQVMGTTTVVAEVVCASKDDEIKTQILSATLLMCGLSTLLMSTIGVRLPIFQGPTVIYIINLLELAENPEWKCPKTVQAGNGTGDVLFAVVGNDTLIPMKEYISRRIGLVSGSLLATGVLHCLLGALGLVGLIVRYVGPITIVPAITLVGINIFKVTVRFSETSWAAAVVTSVTCLVFSLYISNRKTPIPAWSPKKGFHIVWFPLHQMFAILLSMIVGWSVCAILTAYGFYSSDPDSNDYFARTDSRLDIYERSSWLTFPYFGRFGPLAFSTAAFVNFVLVTILSVMDSIGDYSATARVTRVPPPPTFAFNRGIAVEGFMTILSGGMGCCHGTVSFGGPIGVIGLTRVASRSVFQTAGVIIILLAFMGKLGALFITIPYPVIGGAQFVSIGIFIGVVFSYLQLTDLKSSRNLAIIGMALLLGLMIPYWAQKSGDSIQTGFPDLDKLIRMLLSNASLVGGLFACALDNTVPGTTKERGLDAVRQDMASEDEKDKLDGFDENHQIYRLPCVPKAFRRSIVAKWLPLFDKTA